MSMLAGKRVLVTGVARADSIAFAVADQAQRLGAEVALAVFPRDLEGATETVKGLSRPPVFIVSADVTDADDVDAIEAAARNAFGEVDAVLHAIAFAPSEALGGVIGVPASAVEVAFRTSTHTFASLAGLLTRLAPEGGASLVGLDFDSAQAWPVYNWMGPCKAALRSLNQYLARDLGPSRIRSNLVAAGPLSTRAAGGIPDFERLLGIWEARSPIPWDPHDPRPVADAVCFLFSDFARAITGEVLHADGGVHAVAAGSIDDGPRGA